MMSLKSWLKLFSLGFIQFTISLFGNTVEVWGGNTLSRLSLSELKSYIETASFQENFSLPFISSENGSYLMPDADYIFVNRETLSPYETACVILDAKKTNASYLILNTSASIHIHNTPNEILNGSFNLYNLDDLYLPHAESIYEKPITILTKDPTKENSSTHVHKGVFNSIVRGAGKTSNKFRINPSRYELSNSVIALCPPEDTILSLKALNEINTLLLGPNMMFSEKHAHADGLLVPSKWVKDTYLTYNQMPYYIWASGVDPLFWTPNTHCEKTHVTLYLKNASDFMKAQLESLLKWHNIPFITIVYGSYSLEEYKIALNRSKCAIVFSHSESQGLALAEAWAMDVPTLCFNTEGVYYAEKFWNSNAAPYLNPNLGHFWYNLEQLNQLLPQIDTIIKGYSPRRWVLRNMTDEISFLELLRIFKEVE